MKSSRCNSCGGFSFRADRALAGRLVCNNCGTPINSIQKLCNDFFTKRCGFLIIDALTEGKEFEKKINEEFDQVHHALFTIICLLY